MTIKEDFQQQHLSEPIVYNEDCLYHSHELVVSHSTKHFKNLKAKDKFSQETLTDKCINTSNHFGK